MDLDFNKYCFVDGSPTTVLPAPRHRSGVASRKPSGKPNYENQEFEIGFGDYHSGLCIDERWQRINREGSELLKRGSVYQSSKEVSLIQKTDAFAGRRKIEFSPPSTSMFSVEMIDSLCSSDEETSAMSFSEQSTPSGYGNGVRLCYDDFTTTLESASTLGLQEPLSARLSLPCSPAKSATSPKVRFSPVKKMFDNNFVKSKSRRNPPSNSNESRGETVCRSLLGDLLEKSHDVEYNHKYEEKNNHSSVQQCSPAHLHGILKLGKKHGLPFFQFSVKSPEDVYVAKTWKVEDALAFVYTFYLLPSRRKHGSKGWGFREGNKESSMVGRMHVSCHLHKELKGTEESNDTVATEFVLYDILHSRNQFGSSAAAKSHLELEVAAIVIQAPLEKRESLKFKSGDKKIVEIPPNMVDHSTSYPGKMHVVVPAGNHSFSATGGRGPSPLLDRWRSGGGCDCGGWDMACPLTIFTEAPPLINNHHCTELFAQGRKDNMPAFMMRAIEDGKYAVDFHAQFSSLQAFSICVAILHAAEASPIKQETSKTMLQSNALKVYTEEEIETMLDAIAEEEKSKAKKMDEVLQSSLLNPPFSPVARV